GHTAHFADGGAVVYERLLSTLPLDTLVGLSDIEPALGPVLRHLRYSSTHVIGIGLHGRPGPHLGGKCWIYFPEDDCPFYRVTVFSHYSPSNVPDATRYWSLMAEVSESDVKVVDAGRVVEDTVEGLVRTGLIPGREAVHHVWHRRLEHGYPTPSLHYDRALDVALPALEAYDVWSRGRFGAWKYEVSNQDHSFAQGVEAVEHWLLGELSLASKDGAAIELILVGSVTALDLPVAFRATSRDVAVREAEIAEVPSEVGAELGAMVGLDPLNGRREAAAQFVDEVGRRADRVVRIGSASLRQWP